MTRHGCRRREKLRRVARRRGGARAGPAGSQPEPKRGEPHDWLRGATNPQGVDAEEAAEVARNDKGGTSAEVGSSVPKDRRLLRKTRVREWTRGTHVGGGAIFEIPGEESGPSRTRRRAKPSGLAQGRRRRGQGPRVPVCVFKGEIEGHGGSTHGHPRPVWCADRRFPRRSARKRQGHGGKAGKANDLQLPSVSMKPRCDSGCSCDDIGRLEGPTRSREAASICEDGCRPARCENL